MASVGLRACVPAFFILALSACGGGTESSSTTQADQSIAISSPEARTASVGAAYQLQVVASGPRGVLIGYSIQRKPAWLTFDTRTGSLQGMPGATDVGNYPNVVVTASDGSSSASTPPFTITVTQPDTSSSTNTTNSTNTSTSTSTDSGSKGNTSSSTNTGSSTNTNSGSKGSPSTSTSTGSST